MGFSFFSRSSSSSSSSSSVSNKSIRLVHLNGHIEEYDHPVTVYEVTIRTSEHFVCTPAQLLSAYSKPLLPDTLLKPDQIYFLLPFSVFQSAVSPHDFKPIVKKLISIAKGKHFKTHYNKSKNRSCTSPADSLPSEEENLDDDAVQRGSKSRSWKPVLPTIRERSFNWENESDLQEGKELISYEM